MKEMLRILKGRGYKQASLAVQKVNYVVRMYQKTDAFFLRYLSVCHPGMIYFRGSRQMTASSRLARCPRE